MHDCPSVLLFPASCLVRLGGSGSTIASSKPPVSHTTHDNRVLFLGCALEDLSDPSNSCNTSSDEAAHDVATVPRRTIFSAWSSLSIRTLKT
ncbi:hypothetical protein K469DRAFT_710876 [Zopfia rhizophila CBS 207.26]|uniref:Uncharacterized protein n=1 Tax=Zopfia rhizophila CBS 207.26 TaxID=1314779 RepID=A0A6A6DZK1_9PEZI|nr:hypothetical protein K469DRAFT_710876 [Zopfia rhizophila CBS 207.26]